MFDHEPTDRMVVPPGNDSRNWIRQARVIGAMFRMDMKSLYPSCEESPDESIRKETGVRVDHGIPPVSQCAQETPKNSIRFWDRKRSTENVPTVKTVDVKTPVVLFCGGSIRIAGYDIYCKFLAGKTSIKFFDVFFMPTQVRIKKSRKNCDTYGQLLLEKL